MPITIKTGSLKFKDPDTEKYVGIDVAAETKASQQLASIEAAGEAQVASITQNGEAQMADITENGESQMADITQNGQTQMANITQNGQTQVAAIQTAGQAQVSNIETKGAETLDSIPDDYTDLYNDVGVLKSAISSKPDVKDSTKTGVDLDISDADGNVILRLKDGNIETKNFNSQNSSGGTNVQTSTKTGVDLDVADSNGNVIMRLKDGFIITKGFDSTEYKKEKVVTVKKDGLGDYTTLRGAIDSITDASRDNPYRIEIYPGTYNVMADYTEEEIREADVPEYHQGFVGPLLGDGVSLVGVGCRDDIIIYGTLDPETYNSTIRGNISTLNTQGTMRLENLTVVSLYLRYCVHDDFYAVSSTEQYDRVVRNCRFDMQRNVTTTTDDNIILPNSYGAGMDGKGMNSLFDNCDFSTGLGIHTAGSNSAFPTHHLIQNCSGYAFRPNDRNENVHHEFIVNNCNFDIIRYGHYSDSTKQVFYISGTGNHYTMLNCSASDVINIGNRTRHKNTMNLPVLTMVKRNGSTYAMTTDGAVACGIIVLISGEYAYIQKGGYINSNILGMSNLAIGDYITVDSSGVLTTTGATEANAVGIVTNIDEHGIAYMKMLVGQEE